MKSFKKSVPLLIMVLIVITVVFVVWRNLRPSQVKKQIVKDESASRLVVQLGHSSSVRAVTFSHNARLALTGSEDRTAVLWEVATGKEIRRFVGHTAGINAIAFSPDDRFVLTGSGPIQLETDNISEPISDDSTVRIWEVNTGKELLRLEATADPNAVVPSNSVSTITSVAFSPDGKFVMAGLSRWEGKEDGDVFFEGIACLWNVETGKKIRQFKIQSSSGETKSSVAFSPDGHLALVGFDDSPGPELFDIATGKRIRQFAEKGLASFSYDGQQIFVSNGKIYNTQTGKLIKRFTNPSCHSVFSLNGQFIVARKSDGDCGLDLEWDLDMEVWDVSIDKRIIKIYENANNNATRIMSQPAFSPDNKFVLVGLEDGTSQIWNIISLKKEISFMGQAASYESQFSSDGRLIMAGNELWNITTGKLIQRFYRNQDTYRYKQGAFSPDSRQAFFLYNEYYATQNEGALFDLQTGQEVQHYKFGNMQVMGPVFSPNGKLVMTVDDRNFVNLWDISSGQLIQSIEQGQEANRFEDCPAAIFSPDGHFIFTTTTWQSSQQNQDNYHQGFYNRPGLFSVETGELIKAFTPKKNPEEHIYVNAAAFSPDGRFVVSVGSSPGYRDESMAIMWDIATGREIRRLEGHSEYITGVAFSPDGRFLLTAGNDRFAVLWEVATGKMIRKLESHLANGLSVSFSPNGRFILTGSQDGAMAVWDFVSGQELCRLTSFENGDWVVTTSDGRFDTNNLEDIQGMHWIISNDPLKPLPLEIFMRQYYEPRLLARILAGEKFKPLPSLAELNRTQPEVKIINVSPDSKETVQVTVEVASVKSTVQKDINGDPIESGVFDVYLFRNGQLVSYAPTDSSEEKSNSIWSKIISSFSSPSTNDGEIKLNKDGKATLTFSKIRLPRTGIEQIEFSAYAFNADRIKSATDRKTYTITPRLAPIKGHAYIISLGINAYEREGLNLRYAANDSRQVQNTVVNRLALRGDYEDVIGIPLISDYEVILADGRVVSAQEGTLQQVRDGKKRIIENQATKAHLRAVLDALAGREANADLLKAIPNADKLRAARPEDLVLLSVSSHGYTDSEGIFYIVPSDTGTAAVSSPEFRTHCVSSDELSRWLRDVDAGELVMIVDACHSAAAVEGTAFKPGPMGSRGLGQLSYDKGMRILTATQADNVALETNKVRQGLLIYALLQDGLSAWRADYKPQDKSILLSEWLNYGVERVPHLYSEVKDGRIRSVRETSDLLESEDKVQQPSLFDFARRRQELVLARQP
jgi:WD40 repeat protein/uncharacterized caspase-like protein